VTKTGLLFPLPQEKEAAIPIDLIKSLRQEKVLALVGAGLSIPLKFPSWDKLIKEIFRQVESTSWFRDDKNYKWLNEKSNTHPDWVAEVLHTEQKESFRTAVKEVFKKRELHYSYNHALLALLPFKGYVTTNYDTLIELDSTEFHWRKRIRRLASTLLTCINLFFRL